MGRFYRQWIKFIELLQWVKFITLKFGGGVIVDKVRWQFEKLTILYPTKYKNQKAKIASEPKEKTAVK